LPADPVRTLAAALASAAGAELELERPGEAEHGDYATNVALRLAGARRKPPREIAAEIAGAAEGIAVIERTEVAGPGFVNLFLRDEWFAEALREILGDADDGSAGAEKRERVQVEMVSANPTGPVTVASARNGAYGDALARLFAHSGHEVEREYYYNDSGAQMDRFRASVEAARRGAEPPEDGYQGAYIKDLADLEGDPVPVMLKEIEATLERFRVHFDSWRRQSELENRLPELLPRLDTYEQDGALWARSSAYGDDEDRVLLRSGDRTPTYRAADVAYLVDKLDRGFDRAIYVLGADHHGYIARLRAIASTLGEDPARVEVPILQFVHIVEGGGRAAMSKRRGDFVTLDELIGRIGVDATRWFMLSRSHDSTIDLDLDLAAKQDPENPVYYVQMMHARISGIFRQLNVERVDSALAAAPGSITLNDSERELVRKVLAFPGEVGEAVMKRAPHRIATYALELGQVFSAFYRDSPVRDEPDADIQNFRIVLSRVAQRTLAAALGLLGVSAPESM
jgi:arginyl-tRNA synthetase